MGNYGFVGLENEDLGAPNNLHISVAKNFNKDRLVGVMNVLFPLWGAICFRKIRAS